MKESHKIKAVIILFSIFIFLTSFVTGESIDDNLFRWITGVTSAVILIWTAYDKWIWRWPLFSKLSKLSGTPVLHGTWKGVLQFESDESGKEGEVEIYLSINQTLSTISVRSFFKKPSESYSIVAKIEKLEPDRKQLIYLYKSESPYGKRKNNRPHDGACVLNIIGKPVKELSGSYFTEREGAGTVKVTRYNSQLSETFENASELGYS